MPAYLSPIGNEQQSDASGNPLAGGFIYTYLAGTSTLAATFTDAAGTIPQANPIVLNASGLPASPIYINGGQAMKFIIQNSASVTQRTIDNIEGVNDPEFTGAVSEWINYSESPTFVNATSFSVVGDQTLIFQVYRRLKTTNSGGTVYSTISNSVFGAGVTTVTVINDSGVLDSGLSNVQYSLLEATNPSIPESTIGRLLRTAANASTAFATTRIDVASATTVNLTTSAPNTQHINITGTTTITGFTIAAGVYYFVRFAGALTLTNNANIVTQRGANITTVAGDTCVLRATAANTVEVLFLPNTTIPDASITPAKLTQPFTAGTAINTTSGTSHDFTSLPSWINLIYLSFDAVSTNGSSNLMVQIGDSGGVETTGYVGGTTCQTSASPVSGNLYGGTGFEIFVPTGAGDVYHGHLILTRVSGNKWSASGNFNLSNSNRSIVTGGTKTLSATLDRIRLTTLGGTDAFDAGSINILYQ